MPNRAFIRFPNLLVPSYGEVSSAYVRLTAFTSQSDTPVNLRVGFADVDDAVAPTNYAELQAISVTEWVTWSGLSSWVDGTQYDTPSLISSLQAVIDRLGWDKNQAVMIIIEDVSSTDYRDFSAVEFNEGFEKAELHVCYRAREGIPDFVGDDDGFANQKDWGSCRNFTEPFNGWPLTYDPVHYFSLNNSRLKFFSNWTQTDSSFPGSDTVMYSKWYFDGNFSIQIGVETVDEFKIRPAYDNAFAWWLQFVPNSQYSKLVDCSGLMASYDGGAVAYKRYWGFQDPVMNYHLVGASSVQKVISDKTESGIWTLKVMRFGQTFVFEVPDASEDYPPLYGGRPLKYPYPDKYNYKGYSVTLASPGIYPDDVENELHLAFRGGRPVKSGPVYAENEFYMSNLKVSGIRVYP